MNNNSNVKKKRKLKATVTEKDRLQGNASRRNVKV
jgi:hypothetical protein